MNKDRLREERESKDGTFLGNPLTSMFPAMSRHFRTTAVPVWRPD